MLMSLFNLRIHITSHHSTSHSCHSFFVQTKEKERINIDRSTYVGSAINLPPSPTELPEFLSILDSDSSGYASYEPFLAICALKLHSQSRSSESHASEVDEAFALFTAGSAQAKITKAGLQRVARMLNIEVEEQVLNDMILEANGGAGVGVGVERDEFEGVMRRAGVWW